MQNNPGLRIATLVNTIPCERRREKSAVQSTNFKVEEALLTSVTLARVVFRGAAWGQWGGAPFDLTSPRQGGF